MTDEDKRLIGAAFKIALYPLMWVAITLGTFYGSGGAHRGSGDLMRDIKLLLLFQLIPLGLPILMLGSQGRRILPWIFLGGVIGTFSEVRFLSSEIGHPDGWLFYIVMLAGSVTGFVGSVGLIVNAIRDRKWESAFACTPLLFLCGGAWWLTRAWLLAD